MKKPIKIFYSTLTNTFWASDKYKCEPIPGTDKERIVITGAKYDVTQDIAQAIKYYDIEFLPVDSEASLCDSDPVGPSNENTLPVVLPNEN